MSFLMQLARLESKVKHRPRLYVLATTILFAGCFGPWLLTHFGHLWRREHYQFFPMMLLAVAGLSYGCWKKAAQHGLSFQTLKFSTPLFVFATLTFAGALWLNSPWLAFLTTIVVLWAILRNMPFGCSSIAPLFVLLPLPFTMDGELVHGLQRFSSRGASALLDLASIRHLMSGNILELSDKNFFVEEACSGIGSVYLLLASAAVYSSWRQLRLVVTIPLLLSAVFWAVAGNTFRIFCVAWAHENLQFDLSSGTLHDILGSATYLMSLLLLMMTEQTLLFVIEPVDAPASSTASETKAQTMAATVARFWNQQTEMDAEVRIKKLLEQEIPGYRISHVRFLAILIVFFSLGCAGNLWRFWPAMVATAQLAFASSAPAVDKAVSLHDTARSSVVAPILTLKPELFQQIGGLSVVSTNSDSAINDAQPQTDSSNATLDAMDPNLQAVSTSRSRIHRVEWHLEFSETPVLLLIEGPYRLNNASSQDGLGDASLSDVGTWTVTESETAPIADVADDLPVVQERLLKNEQTQFRHELISEFTQGASPLPMLDRHSLAGVRLQLAEKVASETIHQNDWFWRVTLRFDSAHPAATSVRPARTALFGDILKSLLEHWRKSV